MNNDRHSIQLVSIVVGSLMSIGVICAWPLYNLLRGFAQLDGYPLWMLIVGAGVVGAASSFLHVVTHRDHHWQKLLASPFVLYMLYWWLVDFVLRDGLLSYYDALLFPLWGGFGLVLYAGWDWLFHNGMSKISKRTSFSSQIAKK